MSTVRPPNVLSIQSHVVYGHAGNSAATFPMRRNGVNVWPLNTVQFSNHTQYPEGWEGMIIPGEQIGLVCDGLERIGALEKCDAVLSGYTGTVEQGQLIQQVVARVRALNPRAVYCCDPVMGMPEKGCVVAEDVTEFLAREACTAADIICPNVLELEKISGRPLRSVGDAVAACRQCLEEGDHLQACLVKHLAYAGRDPGAFEMLLVGRDQAPLHIATPLLHFDKAPVGVGDLTSGLFLSRHLALARTHDDAWGAEVLRDCLEFTANAYYCVMETTSELGSYELELVAAQDSMASPPSRFAATSL